MYDRSRDGEYGFGVMVNLLLVQFPGASCGGAIHLVEKTDTKMQLGDD